ncbi:helix-turn-helix domain-containing protein [Acidisoma cellulosilyticum]
MLEADYGADLAYTVARIMVVEHLRAGERSQHSALLAMNPRSDRIQTALTYARQNLRGVLSVEVLAQAAGLGPRQFSRAFRTETGTSPAKAIETLRIEAAQLMIEQSNHPIEIIAAETGFGDQERMRRAFQRVLGRPPQAIRAQAKAR